VAGALIVATSLAHADQAESTAPVVVPAKPASASAPPCCQSAEADPSVFKVYWKDGLRFDTADKAFRLKLGGRIYNDWAWFDQDKSIKNLVGKDDNGTEFRSARLYAAGEIYQRAVFKAEYDFEDGDSSFKDVYVGLVDLPFVGMARVGHFKEPFSLEELTSSRFITFMERALPNALVPGRNTGFGINNAFLDDHLTFGAGVFYDSNDFGESTGDNYQFTARVTGLPWAPADDQFLHIGGSVRVGDPDDNSLSFSERPESHLANNYVDTGTFTNAQSQVRWGIEAATVCGPFSVQGEYIATNVDRNGGLSNADFSGWYVFASWFITGEHRAYKRADAAFDRIKPKSNFLIDHGTGAVELALRYSTLSLADGGIQGGELSDITAGLNWYLNPNMRVMSNYVHADLQDLNVGDTNLFEMRFQVDF